MVIRSFRDRGRCDSYELHLSLDFFDESINGNKTVNIKKNNGYKGLIMEHKSDRMEERKEEYSQKCVR